MPKNNPVQSRQFGFLTIQKVKTVLVPIYSNTINKEWRFEPDGDLTNSLITGIRCLSSDYRRTDKTMLSASQMGGFCLYLINEQNRRVIDGAPWYSFVAANDTGGLPITNQKRGFTKCRMRFVMDKSFVMNYQDPSFPADGVTRYLAVQFAYIPKNR